MLHNGLNPGLVIMKKHILVIYRLFQSSNTIGPDILLLLGGVLDISQEYHIYCNF